MKPDPSVRGATPMSIDTQTTETVVLVADDGVVTEDSALVEDELLVEEVSIDGMCGVY
jgi:mycofactocin precursor